MKSAYELAMERLEKKDREDGIENRPLTDAQREQIAELRQDTKAKLAEVEILVAGKRAEAAGDPAKLAEVEEHYRIDRRRLEDGLETAIERIKRGE
ncbi:hypothetical protein ABI59_07625 [Acidobacteria bacterium Mor1]|nr:hypothetical protein ABI59_07625 [Acidobacteria bacterium Mor1]